MTRLPRLRPTRSGRRSGGDRRARERRVLYVGLAVSLVLHVVFIGLAGRWLDPEIRYVPATDAPLPEPDPGLRVVSIAESSESGIAPDVDEPEPPAVRPARPQPPAAVPGEVAPETERRTTAERLAPRVIDPRLWRPQVLLPRAPTFAEAQERVAAAVEMLSDSALAEAERAMRARDWTVEDADGGRWGISPGKIHLGSVTLPLPIYFPMDMEAEARNAYWFELETQLDRAEFLESFDARVKAIRERRDRERGERRPSSNSNR